MQGQEQTQSKPEPMFALDVDVWRIDLVSALHETTVYRGLLSGDEIQRADSFRFELNRNHFIIARAAMRTILAGYMDLDPRQLVFSYGSKSKPQMRSTGQGLALEFNLSHSRDLALLAVARGARVGVDIEFVNPKFADGDLASRFFSPGEVCALESVPANLKAEAFCSCWTRKEAYVKALGLGLSLPLDRFEVSLSPGLPAMLLKPDLDDSTQWSMYDVDAPPGYKAALVVEGYGHQLRYSSWSSEASSAMYSQPVNKEARESA